MWRRNRWPRPLPSAAPSTRPGMSAMTNSVPSRTPPTRTTPRCGIERGERVVGDLRLGRRDGGDQGGLAGVGEAHQGHVGHELELHVEPALLALLALLGEGRGPAAVGEEAGIAPPALAALGDQEAVAVTGQVALHGPLAVAHHGADRDGDDDVLAPGAVPLLPRAVHRRRWPAGRDGPGSPRREDWLTEATSQTSPPWPPSPPSGPPRSTWASRRHDTAPAPPSPARACSWA